MGPKVVIVGAGYAGVSAAKRLARDGARVTVVNPRDEFVERIRLHQLVAGTRAATVPLTGLLPRSTALVQDSVTDIDADARSVRLAEGAEIDFEYLVYAVGSRNGLGALPGAAEHAVAIGDLDGATVARQRLAGLPDGSVVTVVGGGLTGVELAAELAERGRHAIRLVTSGPVASDTAARGRDYVRRYLPRLGVDVLEHAPAAEIRSHEIALADGRVLGSDLSIVATTIDRSALAADSGLDSDPSGALLVDHCLVSTSSPAVVGAGDGARISGAPLRPSCQAAIPLGAHAAETVLRLAGGSRPRPVRPKFTGRCVSLGRRAALWQHSDRFDVPTNWTVTGRPGALIKEQVCAASLRFALNPALSRLSYSWS